VFRTPAGHAHTHTHTHLDKAAVEQVGVGKVVGAFRVGLACAKARARCNGPRAS